MPDAASTSGMAASGSAIMSLWRPRKVNAILSQPSAKASNSVTSMHAAGGGGGRGGISGSTIEPDGAVGEGLGVGCNGGAAGGGGSGGGQSSAPTVAFMNLPILASLRSARPETVLALMRSCSVLRSCTAVGANGPCGERSVARTRRDKTAFSHASCSGRSICQASTVETLARC